MIPTQIDIIELSKIIGAFSVILGVIIGGYKLYDKLVGRLEKLEDEVDELKTELARVKKEDSIIIYALRACLDGLHQQGCNGAVTEAMNELDKHINKAAHDIE